MNQNAKIISHRGEIENHFMLLLEMGAENISSGRPADWKSGEDLIRRASKLIAPLTYLENIISRQID